MTSRSEPSNGSSKPKILAVVGPTASGKTALGIALAHKFDGEVISADSRQVYRGMDIGTAKAPIAFKLHDPAEPNEPGYVEGIPHYMVDIKDPDEDYAVGEFKHDADAAIEEILSHGKVPIVVGGTGLYVRAVIENLDIPNVKADPKLRHTIERDIERDGLEAMFKKLVALDPEAAYIVDPKNPRRVIRALEVALLTGIPFTAQRRKNEPLWNVLELGINPAPELLRERIDKRIDEMVCDGLVDEVKKLLKKYGGLMGTNGITAKKLPVALDAIGYREIIDALNGRCSIDAAIAAMKLNTWHFAKRQMTWFKKDKKIHWVADELAAVMEVKEFLRS